MGPSPTAPAVGRRPRIGVAPSMDYHLRGSYVLPRINVHKRDSYIAVLDEDGGVVEGVRVCDANPFDDFAQQDTSSKAAIEATSNYYTIYDRLSNHLDVVVTDPYQAKAIGSAEVKDDRIDAKLREQLRRAGMIAESYVSPDEIRGRRELVRGRKRLVEKRTDFKNEVHTVIDHHEIEYSRSPFSEEGRDILVGEDLSLGVGGESLIESCLEVIDELTDQIERLENGIGDYAASLEETQLLMTILGVNFYLPLLITADVSYAGPDPVVRESGDSRTEENISKHGGSDLRWILVQCANVIVNWCNDPYLGWFYTRLKRRKNHQIAIVATTRKLLVSVYHMLTREEVYDSPGVSA